jgi:hypothetical protein
MIQTALRTVRAIAASAIISLGLAVQGQAFLLVAAEANPPLGAAYYVATNGSDSNDGLAPATANGHGPFATIQRCHSQLQSQSNISTCYIRGGTYNIRSADNTGSCFNGSAFTLDSSSDAGTTYAYYPPDGVNSAVINDIGSIQTGFCIQEPNVTINGLTVSNWGRAITILGNGGNGNALIENNVVYGTTFTNTSIGAIGIQCNAQNNVITHNYVYNAAGAGITAATGDCGSDRGIAGTIIEYNVIGNTCTGTNGDCGSIYLQDTVQPSPTSLYVTIQYNWIGANSGSFPVYLDDGLSYAYINGNLLQAGTQYDPACAMIHGGSGNVYTNNICDLGGGGGSTSPAAILVQQQTAAPGTWPMTGN